ncbi:MULTISPECIES: LTA synthase family protein [Rhodanobacter]|uniref:LTA synthase family protein n=1 Tax=Rhodanobacter TaxID=75309 RepID=UPI0004111443|nr:MULTISPECIES: LTA synthase family protein [Rhodanobacter]TAN15623.1 MAG: LTA synthase family protein [Rhodanobacter sp.]UJJ55441.1 LTA synthase family protein [Rhodanobacter thiooxydans]
MSAARHGQAWSRFSAVFPALLPAQFVLAAGAVAHGVAGIARGDSQQWVVAGVTLAQAALALLRAAPILLLLSLPLLALKRPRLRVAAVAVLWSLFIAMQVALDQYFQVARVPLGADLFGYSVAEIRTTLSGGLPSDPRSVLAYALPLLVLWGSLHACARWWAGGSGRWTTWLLTAGLLAWLLPLPTGARVLRDDAARDLASNKLAWFCADVWRWSRRGAEVVPATGAATAVAGADEPSLDPQFPFLHAEQTPDTLGPYFAPTTDGRPPNLVVIVVEGLGRSFSGPQASLGSFTPFLDELAARSLYFDNFLANQGRTFGVLPSLFNSAPFARAGFTALGARMPPGPGLFSLLRRQGYHTAFYNGTDTRFDNERAFLQLQGVQHLVDLHGFGAGYQRNPFSEWGYPDRELVSRVLADSAQLQTPFLLAMQTISMHTAYQFPGQDAYLARFERRLRELRIDDARLAAYRADANIYSTILYTDEQLRRYFDAVAKLPWYANTLFVITGDHRLPELPMGEHLDRYHVPLIIYSPLLRQARRIRAVSSQLDVTPSLLALLSHAYGLQRPARTPWLGTGLDLDDRFRNTHQLPLQQTKTSSPDYLAGRWWLHEGKLFELQEGMHLAPVDDARTRDWVVRRLQRYEQANAIFLQQMKLAPDGATPPLVAYREAAQEAQPVGEAPVMRGLSTASAEMAIAGDGVQLTATFSNGDAQASRTFVPLAVLTAEDGRELQEVSGRALQLPAGGQQQVRLTLQRPGACGSRCYVSVFPSDPQTGRAIGQGRYHVPLDVHATAGNAP